MVTPVMNLFVLLVTEDLRTLGNMLKINVKLAIRKQKSIRKIVKITTEHIKE